MASPNGKKRWAIFQRDGWRCHYCRLEVVAMLDHSHPRRATIDHKTPRSRGGSDLAGNLVTACNRCNEEKADIPYESYRWFRHMLLRGHSRQELLDAISEVHDDDQLSGRGGMVYSAGLNPA